VQRRSDIEGLRAIAVLSVLLFHAGVPGLTGGYVGVDVFFVVSGFLITSLLVTERTDTQRISLPLFYARRIRRILPVSAVVAITTLAAAWVWLEPLRLRSLATDLVGVATFSSNFVFANRGADYLQSSLPPSALQHYWSLAVEEQFYLVWPVLVAFACWSVRPGSRFGVRARIGILSLTTAVVSFALLMQLMNTSQSWAFFSPHTRAFELAIGALVAVLPVALSRRDRMFSAIAGWCGLAGVLACVFLFTATTKFPGPWALAPVIATAALLRGGNVTQWAPQYVLRNSAFQWLGSRSYSAYLWHWPVLIIFAAQQGRPLSVYEGLGCVLVALALSEVSYHLIENPIRLNKKITGRRAGSLAVSLVALMAGIGIVAQNNPPVLAGTTQATTPTFLVNTTVPGGPVSSSTTLFPTAPMLPPFGTPIDQVIDALKTTGLPTNLAPSLSGALTDMPEIYRNKCHADFSTTVVKKCEFGEITSAKVIGLYGDSHAAEWFPSLEKVAIKRNWKLITYTKRGCPPVEIPVYSSVLGKVYTECVLWRKNVLTKMVSDGVQVVFIASFDRLLSATTKIPMWQKEWREGFQGTIDVLKGKGIVPVLIQDTPYPGQDIPTCLSQYFTEVDRCSLRVSAAIRDDMTQIRRDFEKANVGVVWTQNWFCSVDICPTIMGNILVYRDDNHLTVAFASFIAPLLDAAIFEYVEWFAQPQ